jgi:hypothetical protein
VHTQSPPENPSNPPQAGPTFPSPSKSAPPNANLLLRTAATAVSVTCPSEDLPLPPPPPEVVTLLSAQSSGTAVSPVLARNSPLVPCELPSEIGHFWLGLFRISVVKVIVIPAVRSENGYDSSRVSCLWLGENMSSAKCHVGGPNGSTHLALFSGMGTRRRGVSQGQVDGYCAAVVGIGSYPTAKPATRVQAS